MSQLANLNATDRGQAPSAPEAELYPVMPDEVYPSLVLRSTGLVAEQLDRPIGVETRAAVTEVTTYTRPWKEYPALSGSHGLIPEFLPPPDMIGGQEAWAAWERRTFRSMPMTPWDEGTEIGRR